MRMEGVGQNRLLRVALLAAAGILLLAALWGGLLRLGWAWPLLLPALPALHGPLMVCGFLGTLIGLERAVGTGRRWAYAGPLLTAAGALLALIGAPGPLGPLLITLGSAVVFAVLVTLVRTVPALFTAVIASGGLSWLVGNLLWLAGRPIPVAVVWWIGFLVLTVAGERLELSRMLKLTRFSRAAFVIAVAVFVGGALVSIVAYAPGVRIAGLGMVLLAAWLLVYDMARRRLKAGGQARFIAVTLISGYVWLAAAGVLAILYAGVTAGSWYDATLHAFFLGFVMSMIFAHAPIVFPAVLQLPMVYSPRFYGSVVLLAGSLLVRIAGDLAGWWPGRLWGGLFSAAAILWFLLNTILAVRAGRTARSSQISPAGSPAQPTGK